MSSTVIDLVSDEEEERRLNGDNAIGTTVVKKPTPKRQAQGKRKIEASKKEPNRKNPCPWKPSSSTQWNKWTNSPARRVSPALDDDTKKEDDDDEEEEVVVVDPPTKLAAEPTVAPPRIWWDSDSAIVTHGMLPTLRGLKGNLLLLSNAHSVPHIQQTDQWSCGFRNIQMLLSGLVPLLPSSHPYFQSMAHIYGQQVPEEYWLGLDSATPLLILPSLTQLQQQLEACWKEGFDPDGADHFKHSVVGRPSRIGAVEVGFVFTFWWLDACVVQFIKCFQSRRLLAPFVYRYFCSGGQQARDKSLSCLEWAENVCRAKDGTMDNDPEQNNEDESTVLPMYLQWEGHSVTVVGIEPPSNFSSTSGGTGKTNWSQWNLLIFCPNYECSRLTPTNTTVAPFRLPCRTLLQKDCQLLLCGQVPLTSSERMERKNSSNAITAAKDAVIDFVAGK